MNKICSQKLITPLHQWKRSVHSTSFDKVQHFITLRDLSPAQILHLVKRSMELKKQVLAGKPSQDLPLTGKTLGMLFSKRSTRTRVSAESGWAYFGGHPMFLGMNDIQIGGGEPWQDTSIVISSMVDAILARLGPHSEIEVSCVQS
jgi:ornithine carbamoyltransferase